MDPLAAVEPFRDPEGLLGFATSGRVSRQVASRRDQVDPSPLAVRTPVEPPKCRLEVLQDVEAGVLPERRPAERPLELRRIPARIEKLGREPPGWADLALGFECLVEVREDPVRAAIRRSPLGDRGGRRVEEPVEVEVDGAVIDGPVAPRGVGPTREPADGVRLGVGVVDGVLLRKLVS